MNRKEYRFYAYRLHMVKEQEILFLNRDKITNSAFGARLIKKVIWELGQTDRENFVVVMLNTKLKPIGANLASIGSINGCMVYPREIIKAALNMPCKALMLGHNHPSGDPSPSVEDKLITLMIHPWKTNWSPLWSWLPHICWMCRLSIISSWIWIRMRIYRLQMKK